MALQISRDVDAAQHAISIGIEYIVQSQLYMYILSKTISQMTYVCCKHQRHVEQVCQLNVRGYVMLLLLQFTYFYTLSFYFLTIFYSNMNRASKRCYRLTYIFGIHTFFYQFLIGITNSLITFFILFLIPEFTNF